MPLARYVLAVLAGLATVQLLGAAPASAAGLASDVSAAATIATNQGYRTGVAVLDLSTGQYFGAGDDTGWFATESVVKVMIATELLATGQMSGATEQTAYQMITRSDDDDADALYGLAGGADVLNLVAARYHISDLGRPPSQPGWWGNTEISAKGLVQLYAAIARDPVVGPWLLNAMSHTTEYGADGTYQFFGIPSATSGAAIKQGWGDDGDDSPNAVFNSTGYVDHDHFAVAILTDGSPSTYGSAISGVLTAQARALMPGGHIDDPATHDPVLPTPAVTAKGRTVHVTGTVSDPDAPGTALPVQVSEDGRVLASAEASGRYDIGFDASDGPHTYTVTVGNVGEGSAVSHSTPTITVDADPPAAAPTGSPGGAHSRALADGTWAVAVLFVTGPGALVLSAVAAVPVLLLMLVIGLARRRRTAAPAVPAGVVPSENRQSLSEVVGRLNG